MDTIKFSQFVALMSFTYKALACIFRRVQGKDAIYQKSIAGFISGLWIICDNKQRRKTLALYLMVRMIGDWIKFIQYNRTCKVQLNSNCQNIEKGTDQHNIIDNNKNSQNDNKHIDNIKQLNQLNQDVQNQTLMQAIMSQLADGEVITFTVSQMVIMYSALHAPGCIDSAYYKWIKSMGNMSEARLQHTIRSRIDVKSMYRLPCEKWEPCYPLWHKDVSCLRANVSDFFKCILRAGKMYLPVHFLPVLLFAPQKVLNNPVTYVKSKMFITKRG